MVCRRFQPVIVPEPSVDETYEILLGLRERYEAHHKLRYTDDSLMAASKYSSQYISDRFLPDKVRRGNPWAPGMGFGGRVRVGGWIM
jgi:ATP-dependent Clp protease ATP-binding subunit ClpA